MAQAFTSYVVDNDKSFREALKRASGVVKDFRVPFGLILTDFYRSQQSIWKLQGPGLYPPFKHGDNYEAKSRKEGDTNINGSPYQKFKKKKYGFDYPLLVASGRLAASLSGPNNPDSIAEVTFNSLTVGTSTPYGIYHQSDAPRSKIPLRKFLFIGPEAPRFATGSTQGRAERWFNIINDYALKAVRRSLGQV